MKSYRPISLLNKNYKIYAKLWANRLKQILVEFITDDQLGFLPGREFRDNVRYIMNTIEFYDNSDRKVAWFFIDTEKAFDYINWEFLSSVMRKLELGSNVTNAIQAIYQNQSAAIKINNDTSNYLKIFKSTRQECPLSPRLFIMVIEFLLIKIREDESIRGLKYKGYQYKTCAFADDLVFI